MCRLWYEPGLLESRKLGDWGTSGAEMRLKRLFLHGVDVRAHYTCSVFQGSMAQGPISSRRIMNSIMASQDGK